MLAAPASSPTVQADPEESSNIRHRCYLCDRTYERQDHLTRHLKTHDNERSHRCPDCGKGFNRADLLNRHRSAHAKNVGETFRRRTGKACEACIKAKTKCDDTRPCTRCASKDMLCQGTRSRKGSSTASQESPRPSSPFSSAAHRSASTSTSAPIQDAALLMGLTRSGVDVMMPDLMASNDYQDASQNDGVDFQDSDFTAFFEQIMMPDAAFGSRTASFMPPDVNYMQDTNFNLCDFDFTLLASGLTRPSSVNTTRGGTQNPFDAVPAAAAAAPPWPDAGLRSELFKKSPWSWNHWIPAPNSHTFAGQEEINVEAGRVDQSQTLTSLAAVRAKRLDMKQADRDRMLRVVTHVANRRVAVPSFPSLELLEDLVGLCLLQDCSIVDGYIHSATFACKAARTELLLAMLAAGARFVALAPVWKMGLVVQEVVRLAVAELFESDNSTTRELQPLQTLMLWLDVGAWSGFRRKTEISVSFLQPLVTMLSWSNAFSRVRYTEIIPNLLDPDDVLEAKWRAWAEQEGLKRLIIHVFMHDSQVAFANLKNPLISQAQLSLPLPASREMWLAPTADAWRAAFLRERSFTTAIPLMLMQVLSEPGLLDDLDGTFDKPLCLLAAAHAAGHEVWQIRQSTLQRQRRHDRWLAHLGRQRDSYDDLNTMLAYCAVPRVNSLETNFIVHFLMMSLHVALEDIQTFSGKTGEEEARKVFPRVQQWTQDAQSRTAVWHAGQVFRIARLFEKTKLRDFYAVAFYHAALTLWVYGMITLNTARKSGFQTPGPTSPRRMEDHVERQITSGPQVRLDGDDDRAAKTFTLAGQGTPGLHNMQSDFIPLSNWRGVMLTAGAILKASFPQSANGLPPLVENLANLMNELGRLAGRD